MLNDLKWSWRLLRMRYSAWKLGRNLRLAIHANDLLRERFEQQVRALVSESEKA